MNISIIIEFVATSTAKYENYKNIAKRYASVEVRT